MKSFWGPSFSLRSSKISWRHRRGHRRWSFLSTLFDGCWHWLRSRGHTWLRYIRLRKIRSRGFCVTATGLRGNRQIKLISNRRFSCAQQVKWHGGYDSKQHHQSLPGNCADQQNPRTWQVTKLSHQEASHTQTHQGWWTLKASHADHNNSFGAISLRPTHAHHRVVDNLVLKETPTLAEVYDINDPSGAAQDWYPFPQTVYFACQVELEILFCNVWILVSLIYW